MNCHPTDAGDSSPTSSDHQPDENNRKISNSNSSNHNNSNNNITNNHHKNNDSVNSNNSNATRPSSSKSNNNPVDFLYKMKRAPNKRRVKPVERLQFDLEDENWEDTSSDDEDYKPKKGTNRGGDGGEDDDEDDDDDDDDDDEKVTSQASDSEEDDDDENKNATSDSDASDDENSQDETDRKKLKRDTEDDSQESQEIPMPTLTSIIDMSSQKGADSHGKPLCHSSKNETSNKYSTPVDHKDKLRQLLICSVCLGDYSSDSDEIVECDSCGITVHENCYGIVAEDSDNESNNSNLSSASTEPWFCDACKAGVANASCELCPADTGIFKRTDTKQWVHVVCALYTSGVTFSDTIHLSGITLLELPHDRWGSKSCSLCEDSRLAKTGIVISCDAGMCRTYFHVTCAQRHGLLQDVANLEQETEIVDPFYAHCKLHTTDKAKAKRKKRNYLTLQARCKMMCQGSSVLTSRTAKKLEKARGKFIMAYENSIKPSVNTTDKIPRALTSSPASVKMLIKKADLLGHGSISPFDPLEIRRKWHIPPAFSVEFVAYFIDRAQRIKSMEEKLKQLRTQEKQLKECESNALRKCNETMPMYEKLKKQSNELREKAKSFWDKLGHICQLPSPLLPDILQTTSSSREHSSPNRSRTSSFLARRLDNHHPSETNSIHPSSSRSHSHSTHQSSTTVHDTNHSASTKGSHTSSNSLASPLCKSPAKTSLTFHECGLCKSLKDQHLLALCDSCNLHFHLYCLDPPLTRIPKKTKFGGWQCSDCTEREDEQYSAGGKDLDLSNNGVDDADSSATRKRMRKEPTKFIPDAGTAVNVYKKRKRAAERMRNRRAQLKKN